MLNEYDLVCLIYTINGTKILSFSVAAIKLTSNVIFSSSVKAISLGSVYLGGKRDVTALGWGWTTNPEVISNRLMYFNTKTIDFAQCRDSHKNGNLAFVHPSTICTQGAKGVGT
jgi:hypothetical protein